jgi:hypothetical protein
LDGTLGAWRQESAAWTELAPPTPFQPGARVRWVELVRHARSDELALLALDDQRDLTVWLWDGAGFGTPRRLEANVLFRPGWRPFAAAYEGLSGDLLVAWGFSVFAEETRWATLERASGTWRTGQHPSSDAIGAQILLASDPTSDRISAAIGEGDVDDDVTVSIWNGADWIDTAELTLAGPQRSRLLENVWIGNSGVACVAFRRAGATGSFNVAFLQPTGWRIQPDVILTGVDKAAKVRLESLTGASRLAGAVLDHSGRLFELRFDGARFALGNGGQALASGLDPAATGLAFDAAALAPDPPPTR